MERHPKKFSYNELPYFELPLHIATPLAEICSSALQLSELLPDRDNRRLNFYMRNKSVYVLDDPFHDQALSVEFKYLRHRSRENVREKGLKLILLIEKALATLALAIASISNSGPNFGFTHFELCIRQDWDKPRSFGIDLCLDGVEAAMQPLSEWSEEHSYHGRHKRGHYGIHAIRAEDSTCFVSGAGQLLDAYIWRQSAMQFLSTSNEQWYVDFNIPYQGTIVGIWAPGQIEAVIISALWLKVRLGWKIDTILDKITKVERIKSPDLEKIISEAKTMVANAGLLCSPR